MSHAGAVCAARYLHQDYLNILDPISQRGRPITEVERSVGKLKINDIQEASDIAKLYLTLLQKAMKSFLAGALEQFDATVGDHACQAVAGCVISLALNEALRNEAVQLQALAQERLRTVNVFQGKDSLPSELLMEKMIEVSDKIAYLLRAFFLRTGRELTVSREGVITLRIMPQKIQTQFSKKCSLDVIQKLIVRAKEQMNRDTLQYVQTVGPILGEKAAYLLPPYIQTMRTSREEELQFATAFYNVKAILTDLANKGVPFALSEYSPCESKERLFYFFVKSSEEGVMPRMIRVESVKAKSPILSIEGYFSEQISRQDVMDAIAQMGLIEFALASIAVYPQFIDMQPAEYANHEDLSSLPKEASEEIQRNREIGRSLRYFKIIHVYARTL